MFLLGLFHICAISPNKNKEKSQARAQRTGSLGRRLGPERPGQPQLPELCGAGSCVGLTPQRGRDWLRAWLKTSHPFSWATALGIFFLPKVFRNKSICTPMFIALQEILWNGERSQVVFVCCEKQEKKKSPVSQKCHSERPSPAAAMPIINDIRSLIKSEPEPATPPPRVTASLFN